MDRHDALYDFIDKVKDILRNHTASVKVSPQRRVTGRPKEDYLIAVTGIWNSTTKRGYQNYAWTLKLCVHVAPQFGAIRVIQDEKYLLTNHSEMRMYDVPPAELQMAMDAMANVTRAITLIEQAYSEMQHSITQPDQPATDE